MLLKRKLAMNWKDVWSQTTRNPYRKLLITSTSLIWMTKEREKRQRERKTFSFSRKVSDALYNVSFYIFTCSMNNTKILWNTELKEAIARRNVDVLETAIDNAKSSEFSSNLQNHITEAEQLLAELRKLKRFAHEVLQMKQSTISEIHSYKNPRPLAYDVMKATYFLLGEKEDHLQVHHHHWKFWINYVSSPHWLLNMALEFHYYQSGHQHYPIGCKACFSHIVHTFFYNRNGNKFRVLWENPENRDCYGACASLTPST